MLKTRHKLLKHRENYIGCLLFYFTTIFLFSCNIGESGKTTDGDHLNKFLNYFNGGNDHGYKNIKGIQNIKNIKVDKSTAVKIKVPTSSLNGLLNLSDILDVEKVSFIKLQTKKDLLIGTVDKVFFDDKKIFVVDQYGAQKIFIFNINGELLSEIAQLGKGPDEYLEIRDVAIDKRNKRLIVLDLKGRKLNFYTYDGKFLVSEKMYYFYSSLAIIDDNAMAFSTATASNGHIPQIDNHYLVIGKENGDVICRGFPFDQKARKFSYFNSSPLRVFNSKVYFNPRYTDTIFNITKDAANAEFYLDFGGTSFSKKERASLSDASFNKLKKTKNYFSGDYIISKDWLYCGIRSASGPKSSLFYSLKTGKVFCGSEFMLNNPIQILFKEPITETQNKLVVITQPAELLQLKELLIREKIDPKYKSLLDVSETDNPIILFIPYK